MKQSLFFLALICLFGGIGCVHSSKQVRATDEALVVESEALPVRVLVDPSFVYLGEVEAEVGADREPTRRSYLAQVFVRTDANKKVQTLVVVERGRIEQGVWTETTGDNLSRHRHMGTVGSWLYRGLDNIYCGNDYYVERFILDQGYTLDECWLYDMRTGFVDGDRTDRLSVQVAEPVADEVLGDFYGVEFKEKGLDEFVRAFAERAGKLVRILPASGQ